MLQTPTYIMSRRSAGEGRIRSGRMASLDKQEEPFLLLFFPLHTIQMHTTKIYLPPTGCMLFKGPFASFFFLFSAQHFKLPLPPSLSPLGFPFFFFYFQTAFKLVRPPIFASHVTFIETVPKSCKFKRDASHESDETDSGWPKVSFFFNWAT